MGNGIYALFWEDPGLVYIGQGNLHSRYTKHLTDLKNGKHCNYKVQNAYDTYGKPSFIVLETNCINIANSEMVWISEFDAVKSGLNILPGGEQMSGFNHPRSKHSKATILKVLALLLKPEYTYKKIYERLGVPISSVRDIASGRIHAWISKEYPEELAKVTEIRQISKFSKPKEYPKLRDPTGAIHEVTNIAKFCREHPLLSTNWECEKTEIGRLFKGYRQQHKGFTIA